MTMKTSSYYLPREVVEFIEKKAKQESRSKSKMLELLLRVLMKKAKK